MKRIKKKQIVITSKKSFIINGAILFTINKYRKTKLKELTSTQKTIIMKIFSSERFNALVSEYSFENTMEIFAIYLHKVPIHQWKSQLYSIYHLFDKNSLKQINRAMEWFSKWDTVRTNKVLFQKLPKNKKIIIKKVEPSDFEYFLKFSREVEESDIAIPLETIIAAIINSRQKFRSVFDPRMLVSAYTIDNVLTYLNNNRNIRELYTSDVNYEENKKIKGVF